MKVGLIARGEDRGLGIQTWEWARAMRPDRVLLIDLGEYARGFHVHAERYPNATRLVCTPGWTLPEREVRDWLDGLDVVYTVETFYDRRIPGWAAEQGVATVCHINPEFHKWDPEHPEPSAWWAPTGWRIEHLPARTRIVPVPVPTDRFAAPEPRKPGPVRWLHVVGHRAAMDRNGTTVVLQALRRVRQLTTIRLVTQDNRMPQGRLRRNVEITTRLGSEPNYWRLYDDADALVLPRRYGGLCLPALEAQGAGLAVVMSDAPPQRDTWPAVALVAAREARTLHAQGGAIRLWDTDPASLARLMDRWADDPNLLAVHQAAALEWAQAHSWERLRPLIARELEAVAART